MRRLTSCLVFLLLLSLGLQARAQDNEAFIFRLSNEAVAFDQVSGVGPSVKARVSILEDSDLSPFFPADTQGFQLGIGHDGDYLQITSIGAIGELLDLEPGFEGSNIDPSNGAGVTYGVVYSLTGGVFLVFDEEKEVLELTYELVPANLAGAEDPVEVVLNWDDALGDPAVPNAMVVDGEGFDPVLEDGMVTLEPAIAIPYMRGDCNDDTLVDLADAIFMLYALFIDGASFGTCDAACDTNANGSRDVSDAVYLFNYRLLDGPPPATPFNECGLGSGTEAPCGSYESCE